MTSPRTPARGAAALAHTRRPARARVPGGGARMRAACPRRLGPAPTLPPEPSARRRQVCGRSGRAGSRTATARGSAASSPRLAPCRALPARRKDAPPAGGPFSSRPARFGRLSPAPRHAALPGAGSRSVGGVAAPFPQKWETRSSTAEAVLVKKAPATSRGWGTMRGDRKAESREATGAERRRPRDCQSI